MITLFCITLTVKAKQDSYEMSFLLKLWKGIDMLSYTVETFPRIAPNNAQ